MLRLWARLEVAVHSRRMDWNFIVDLMMFLLEMVSDEGDSVEMLIPLLASSSISLYSVAACSRGGAEMPKP
jgi:hypothetical protein